MACVNIIAAETDEEAQYLATSAYQLVLGLIRNNRKPLAPPTNNMNILWSLEEQAAVKQMFFYSFAGSTNTLAKELTLFAENTGIDEIMATTHVYDVNAKIRSLELTASLFKTSRVESLV
jgi:alkanesulfonate monooxygenase SsuD/methylene tetrahydromethanopterin reductase-like flavin-dependent oxidoreductase (luciferase family)